MRLKVPRIVPRMVRRDAPFAILAYQSGTIASIVHRSEFDRDSGESRYGSTRLWRVELRNESRATKRESSYETRVELLLRSNLPLLVEEVRRRDTARGFGGRWLRYVDNRPVGQLGVLQRIGAIVRLAEG